VCDIQEIRTSRRKFARIQNVSRLIGIANDVRRREKNLLAKKTIKLKAKIDIRLNPIGR